MKVAELSGTKLDFYVAKALGLDPRWWANVGWVPATEFQRVVTQSKWIQAPKYSSDGNVGVDVITSQKIAIFPTDDVNVWGAEMKEEWEHWIDTNIYDCIAGKTPLEAAMRCLVSNKFGDTVEELK